MTHARSGEGWAATSIDDLGDGPGFRKIRPAIGVTAFGMNAIVPHVVDGGADGYVGRDGRLPEGELERVRQRS